MSLHYTSACLRRENKATRVKAQSSQTAPDYWTTYHGKFTLPQKPTLPATQAHLTATPPPRNIARHLTMAPTGIALNHPVAPLLQEYATHGCPVFPGTPWSLTQMQAAIDCGPHVSALIPAAMAQMDLEVQDKIQNNHARLVRWEDICHDPPEQLKISLLAMVPHKSRPYRAILDLSFEIKLSPTESIPSVNSTTTKSAPAGSINQLGHSLQRIIHAFATAPKNAKIFMAKWDIKDGFWWLDCARGEEWNFAYVLPSSIGGEIILVVPTLLQMGWIESPPYFCAASETARDVAAQ